MPSNLTAQQVFQRVFDRQIQSLAQIREQADQFHLDEILSLLIRCPGRLIILGMGKMGAVGRKAAATFSSTGTPAIFVHPSEALHGDLGMITRQDIVLALSYSGETDEVLKVVETVQPWQVPVIALTRAHATSLAQVADHVLSLPVEAEATDLVEVPSCSTTLAMVVCDALAIMAMEARGFTADDFSIFHPGGTLGRRLRTQVADLMRRQEAIPVVAPHQTLRDALVEVSSKGLGATLVANPDGLLLGILTDGDIRRILESHRSPLEILIQDIMSPDPKSCPANMLAAKALRVMEEFRITVLPVTCDSSKIQGIVHLHDLVGARIS